MMDFTMREEPKKRQKTIISAQSENSPLNDRVSDAAILTVSDETCPIKTRKKCLNKILTAKGLEQKKIDIAHS
jgi:hypothetical protein